MNEDNDDQSEEVARREYPRPAEVMRHMHPDLYSDTVQGSTLDLSRPVLDLQLETLTAHNKDTEFEQLARQMAQRLICPNLRPQTGPTGGGDAKVDSETYPVAPEIADRWWSGESGAGSERWAFAFSAKKDWLTKVKSDVTNILSTERDYNRIFFVTNQNVADKKRSAAEDKLTAESGINITILDRNWLLTKVYENDLVGLAVTALQLVGNLIPIEKAGPLDAARLEKLDELEAKIADPTAYTCTTYQLGEDALEAALISRGLERSQFEVEGKLLRAIRLAEKGGHQGQILRAHYNYAWTAHWWFENFALFSAQYEIVEVLALKSSSMDEVQKLHTLWTLLSSLVSQHRMSADDARLTDRTARLSTHLHELSGEVGRPNNALIAETNLIMMRLSDAAVPRDLAAINAVWVDLANVVDRAVNLGSYPLETVYEQVDRMGDFAEGPEYDRLFEKLLEVIAKRKSEGEAGMMLNRRAVQKMEHGRHYDAIRLFGRAEPLLIKEEYRRDLVKALVGGSRSYEQVGLPWAARAKAIAAVDTCNAVFKRDGEMPLIALRAIQQIIWAELVLGRIGHTLSALTLSVFTEQQTEVPPNRAASLYEERSSADRLLAIHLMNSPLADLPKLERLPGGLEKMGLMASAFGLVYALGGPEVAIKEGFVPEGTPVADIEEVILTWRTQAMAQRMAAKPTLTLNGRSEFQSVVLGSRLEFDVPDTEDAFGVAESILAAFESFLATSHESDIVPQTEALRIVVTPEDGEGHRLTLTFDDNDTSMLGRLVHPSRITFGSPNDMSEFLGDVRDAVIGIMSRMFHIPDIESLFSKLMGAEERALDRALTLANLVLLNGNVFGQPSAAMLDDWISSNGESVPFTRTAPMPTLPPVEGAGEPRRIAQEPPPEEMLDVERLAHNDRKVMSPINVQRWNKAGWRGTLFISGGEPHVPPLLCVGYTNAEMGRKIFEEFQAKFGKYDEANDLRVAIIRGIDAENPSSYAVTIGPNLDNVAVGESRMLLGMARINRMTPSSTSNLDRFLAAQNQMGGFILAPAAMNPDDPTATDYFPEFGIAKTHLVVRDAWELEEYDWDMMAIAAGDMPHVPRGADASRVLRGLDRRNDKRGMG